MSNDFIMALLGGMLVGTAASLMLLGNGQVTGIAGIVNGTLSRAKGDTTWRWYFIFGLLLGGLVVNFQYPAAFSNQIVSETWTLIPAGILVGFGVLLGNGCTSGHGVCGICRLSPRSIIATIVFMSAGILTVAVLRHFGILP